MQMRNCENVQNYYFYFFQNQVKTYMESSKHFTVTVTETVQTFHFDQTTRTNSKSDLTWRRD